MKTSRWILATALAVGMAGPAFATGASPSGSTGTSGSSMSQGSGAGSASSALPADTGTNASGASTNAGTGATGATGAVTPPAPDATTTFGAPNGTMGQRPDSRTSSGRNATVTPGQSGSDAATGTAGAGTTLNGESSTGSLPSTGTGLGTSSGTMNNGTSGGAGVH